MKKPLISCFRMLWGSISLVIFISLFIPLILILLNYSIKDSFIIFGDLVLFSVPWLLWVFTVLIFSFFPSKNPIFYLMHKLPFIMLASLILLGIFRRIPQIPRFHIREIQAHTQQIRSPMRTEFGTLIITPLNSKFPFYAQAPNNAILISSKLFSFNSIQTNPQSITLDQASVFTSMGIQLQSGQLLIPKEPSSLLFTLSPTTEYMIEQWLRINTLFNKGLATYFMGKSSPSSQKNTYKALRLAQELPKNIQQKFPKIFKDISVPKIPPINKNDNKIYQISHYLDIFLVLFYYFSIAGLLGAVASLQGSPFTSSVIAVSLAIALFNIPNWSLELISKHFSQLSLQHQLGFSILLLNSIAYLIYIFTKTQKEHSHS